MEIDYHSASGAVQGIAEDPWDETINLETKFYDEGYKAGHDHGQLHGLYEGRELGQEKAWEIWEEVGYMEGFAEFWAEELGGGENAGRGRGKNAMAYNHSQTLLALIESFPTTNPTTTPSNVPVRAEPYSSAFSAPGSQPTDPSESLSISISTPPQPAAAETEPDLILLLSSIRARYKLLCSVLGVRPRLVAAAGKDGSLGGDDGGNGDVQVVISEGVVQGIEGPMKGVDTRMLRY